MINKDNNALFQHPTNGILIQRLSIPLRNLPPLGRRLRLAAEQRCVVAADSGRHLRQFNLMQFSDFLGDETHIGGFVLLAAMGRGRQERRVGFHQQAL